MADGGDTLKSFMVGIGFQTDQSSLRRALESLKAAETQIKKFAAETDRGTTLWGKFFQQFQRSDAPARQHLETTTQLAKGYESLATGLKTLVGIVAGGALVATFAAITKSFS